MVNKVCPFWVHGSGGDFHQCLTNSLAPAWRRKANTENVDKRAKGKSPKKDPKVVLNWFWYTVMYAFLDQNMHGGKINPTPNRGSNAPAHIDQHKTRSALREETKVKSKGKYFTQKENEGRSTIFKNKTRMPVGAAAKEPRKKNKGKSHQEVMNIMNIAEMESEEFAMSPEIIARERKKDTHLKEGMNKSEKLS
jgi:hypothetical protein